MQRLVSTVLPLIFVVVMSSLALGQTDRVYTVDGKNITGTVSAIAKAGIQLKKGASVQTIAASDIVKILWEGDPGEITSAREFAVTGQFDSAIDELKKVDIGKLKRDGQKADFAFYKALAIAKTALAGRGSRESAAQEIGSFLRSFSDSYHFYDATEIFGDLALSLGKSDDAIKYYQYLGRSPSGDTKIRSVYLVARAKAASGDHAGAIEDYDKVIGAAANSTYALDNQTLALAGKAASLAATNQSDAGLAITEKLIDELAPNDVITAAAIYNAEGANYEVAGKLDAAIASYLHTHLMYATDPQRHALALTQLVPLWEKVGQPERAGEMRSLLKELYPGF